MIRKFIVVAAFFGAASVFGAGSAGAQPTNISTIDQREILPHLNVKTIEPALKTVTGNHLTSVDAENREYIIATATNGLRFDIHFHGCDGEAPGQCKAMSLLSTWDGLPKSHAQKFGKKIPEFLVSHPQVNAGMLNGNHPYISRYVIPDFGTAQDNIVSEVANFIRAATDFSNEMRGSAGKQK